MRSILYPDDRLGEVVALAVVPKEDYEINLRALRTYCARIWLTFNSHINFRRRQATKEHNGETSEDGYFRLYSQDGHGPIVETRAMENVKDFIIDYMQREYTIPDDVDIIKLNFVEEGYVIRWV